MEGFIIKIIYNFCDGGDLFYHEKTEYTNMVYLDEDRANIKCKSLNFESSYEIDGFLKRYKVEKIKIKK